MRRPQLFHPYAINSDQSSRYPYLLRLFGDVHVLANINVKLLVTFGWTVNLDIVYDRSDGLLETILDLAPEYDIHIAETFSLSALSKVFSITNGQRALSTDHHRTNDLIIPMEHVEFTEDIRHVLESTVERVILGILSDVSSDILCDVKLLIVRRGQSILILTGLSLPIDMTTLYFNIKECADTSDLQALMDYSLVIAPSGVLGKSNDHHDVTHNEEEFIIPDVGNDLHRSICDNLFSCSLNFLSTYDIIWLSLYQIDIHNGYLDVDHVKHTNFPGLTGELRFDDHRERDTHYTLHQAIPNKTSGGETIGLIIETIGEFDESNELIPMRPVIWPDLKYSNETPWVTYRICPDGYEFPSFSPFFSDPPCSPCPFGYITEKLDCVPCPPGTFGADCMICPPGHIRPESASPASCTPCEPGTRSVDAVRCEKCLVGHYTDMMGSSNCPLCPLGSFNLESGSSECTSCDSLTNEDNLVKFTTIRHGSTNQSSCVCPKGAFLPCLPDDDCSIYSTFQGQRQCAHCPIGMICGGYASNNEHVQPILQKGFMTLSPEPYSPYRCLNDKICPGNVRSNDFANVCIEGRTGVACGSCTDPNTYSTRDECVECRQSDYLLNFIMLFMILPIVLYIVYHIGSNLSTAGTTSLVTLGISSGIVLTYVQTLSVLSVFDVPWPDYVKSIFISLNNLTSVLIIGSSRCFFGQVLTTTQMIWLSVIGPLFIPAYLFSMYFVVNEVLIRFIGGTNRFIQPVYIERCVNTVGLFYQAFSVSFVALSTSTWVCYDHPNGEKSLVLDPSILCGSDTHKSLIAAGVLAILFYSILFYSVCIWAIYMAPRFRVLEYRFLGTVGKFNMVKGFQFLFFRFRINKYYWASIILLRSYLIVVIPHFSSDTHVQLFLLCFILMIFLIIHIRHRPWRSDRLNRLEAFLLLALLFPSILGLFLLDPFSFAISVGDRVRQNLSICIIIIFSSVIFIFSFMILYFIFGNRIKSYYSKINISRVYPIDTFENNRISDPVELPPIPPDSNGLQSISMDSIPNEEIMTKLPEPSNLSETIRKKFHFTRSSLDLADVHVENRNAKPFIKDISDDFSNFSICMKILLDTQGEDYEFMTYMDRSVLSSMKQIMQLLSYHLDEIFEGKEFVSFNRKKDLKVPIVFHKINTKLNIHSLPKNYTHFKEGTLSETSTSGVVKPPSDLVPKLLPSEKKCPSPTGGGRNRKRLLAMGKCPSAKSVQNIYTIYETDGDQTGWG